MNAPTVLLVDDSPEDVQLVLHALGRVLSADHVTACESGEAALDFLFARGRWIERDARALPRVMLLDFNLPRLPGLEVLRQVRADERTRLMPVVMLSASVEQHDIRAAMSAGANSYIRKSLDFAQLSESVTLLGHYWLELNIDPSTLGEIH